MRLLHQNYVKGEEGTMKLVPEESEDMWHVFNLIRESDRVTATTFRKITKESGVGAESERIKLKLTIEVEGVEFDAEGTDLSPSPLAVLSPTTCPGPNLAAPFTAGGTIRLRGKNLTENEHVKLGAYHTLELEQQRAFTLFKSSWDALDIDRVKQATDPALSADLAAVLITEGLAHVCLVGASTTLVRAKVEANLPRKRGAAAAGYDKAWAKFLEAVFTAILRHVDFSIVKCLVIAGPGFAKDQLKEYLEIEAVRREIRTLIENRDKVVLAPASSAYKHSLKEVLSSPGIAARIKNTKAAKEVEALQDFYKMLSEDPARAFYGPGHVFAAAEIGAIQTLLISDSLFRINSVEKRARYVSLVDGVVEAGGEALIFSSMHVSGEQLTQLTGIAAILRFPLEELADEDIEAPF